MKKVTMILVAALMVIFTGCESIKENLVVPITMDEQVIHFEVGAKPQTQDVVQLYDDVMELNIGTKAKELGYDIDKITELLLTSAVLELESPVGYEMDDFSEVKLYFGDDTKMVAQADKVEDDKVTIKIVNGDLLDELKEEKIRIIITGEIMPVEPVKLKLVTDYKAKIKPFK